MDTADNTHHTNEECGSRIFGYGSLLWKPDFQYAHKHIGFIKGFKRRFWQGNDTHRGTKHQIGRVATLVPANKGVVWGLMYEVKGQEAKQMALGSLTKREVTLGGYDVIRTQFYPRDQNLKPVPVTVYIATRKSNLYLGKSSMDAMAMQIVSAKGFAGPNIEYVTKMADYITENIPEDNDSHLFSLDRRVRELTAQKICLRRMIGQEEFFDKHIDEESIE